MIGNKKGVGHFVKHISWLQDGQVQVHLLDLDASEGTARDCAKVIHYSLKKLSLHDGRPLVFKGQSTDSGGGGVLDNLARELRELELCVSEDEDYLIAACGIHCLQLQLSKPCNDLIGLGSSAKRTGVGLFMLTTHKRNLTPCPCRQF